jgi:succinyl-CoA:acetate CoA-transferase
MTSARVKSRKLASMVMPAEEAAALTPAGANVGMSGFTGAARGHHA